MNRKNILIPLLLIVALQLIAFWPSFHLAIFGDDWLAFWRFWTNLDPSFPGHYNPIRFFLTPYGPQDINMGLLSKVFGFTALPYYIVSFLWRLGVSVTLFFVTLKLTKNTLAAFFSGAFFAVSAIGLDTTNWVFNMTSYIGIIFLLFFVLFYFLSRQNENIKLSIIAFVFLFFAIITVPIRMHGALILIAFTEIIGIVLNRSKRNIIGSLIRIGLFILTIMIIKTIGTSFANPEETITRAIKGFEVISTALSQGHYQILIFPLISFGNMIFPQTMWIKVNAGQTPFVPLSILVFITYAILLPLLTPVVNRTRPYLYKMLAAGGIYNILIWFLHKNDLQYFSSPEMVGGALVGGYTAIFLGGLLFNNFFGKNNRILASAILVWPLAFIVLPWITLDTGNTYPLVHRYLIVPSVGIALIWGLLALLNVNKKTLLILFALHASMQFFTTYDYLNTLAQRRSREISDKIWSVVDKGLPKFDDNKLYVVLFATDGKTSNGDIVYNNTFFGFPPRMAVQHKITEEKRIPVGVTGYDSVASAVIDGKMFIAHGREVKPIPPEQIYAFLISGETLETLVVSDITEKIRVDLRKEIEAKEEI